ncbi:MAG: hypothetical protein M0D55_20175 [Elusimicrobiota bacterium]|nr:MAG: hypothetical protein M0D55_20175 [Elusimicrobiota bacterium]
MDSSFEAGSPVCVAALALLTDVDKIRRAAGFDERSLVFLIHLEDTNNAYYQSGKLGINSGYLTSELGRPARLSSIAHEAGHAVQDKMGKFAWANAPKTAHESRAGAGPFEESPAAAEYYARWRRLEAQADLIGQELLVRAGYDGRLFLAGKENFLGCGTDEGFGSARNDTHPANAQRYVNAAIAGEVAARNRARGEAEGLAGRLGTQSSSPGPMSGAPAPPPQAYAPSVSVEELNADGRLKPGRQIARALRVPEPPAGANPVREHAQLIAGSVVDFWIAEPFQNAVNRIAENRSAQARVLAFCGTTGAAQFSEEYSTTGWIRRVARDAAANLGRRDKSRLRPSRARFPADDPARRREHVLDRRRGLGFVVPVLAALARAHQDPGAARAPRALDVGRLVADQVGRLEVEAEAPRRGLGHPGLRLAPGVRAVGPVRRDVHGVPARPAPGERLLERRVHAPYVGHREVPARDPALVGHDHELEPRLSQQPQRGRRALEHPHALRVVQVVRVPDQHPVAVEEHRPLLHPSILRFSARPVHSVHSEGPFGPPGPGRIPLLYRREVLDPRLRPCPARLRRRRGAPARSERPPGSSAVNFDGRFARYGPMLIDLRAPGAPELVKSIADPENKPVLGVFDVERARVVNAFALGSYGVRGHVDAVPPGRDRSGLGGYVFSLSPDGSTRFLGSGHLPATITPAVERAVMRYVGVRPAVETPLQRLRRLWLRLVDEISVLLR